MSDARLAKAKDFLPACNASCAPGGNAITLFHKSCGCSAEGSSETTIKLVSHSRFSFAGMMCSGPLTMLELHELLKQNLMLTFIEID